MLKECSKKGDQTEPGLEILSFLPGPCADYLHRTSSSIRGLAGGGLFSDGLECALTHILLGQVEIENLLPLCFVGEPISHQVFDG